MKIEESIVGQMSGMTDCAAVVTGALPPCPSGSSFAPVSFQFNSSFVPILFQFRSSFVPVSFRGAWVPRLRDGQIATGKGATSPPERCVQAREPVSWLRSHPRHDPSRQGLPVVAGCSSHRVTVTASGGLSWSVVRYSRGGGASWDPSRDIGQTSGRPWAAAPGLVGPLALLAGAAWMSLPACSRRAVAQLQLRRRDSVLDLSGFPSTHTH